MIVDLVSLSHKELRRENFTEVAGILEDIFGKKADKGNILDIRSLIIHGSRCLSYDSQKDNAFKWVDEGIGEILRMSFRCMIILSNEFLIGSYCC